MSVAGQEGAEQPPAARRGGGSQGGPSGTQAGCRHPVSCLAGLTFAVVAGSDVTAEGRAGSGSGRCVSRRQIQSVPAAGWGSLRAGGLLRGDSEAPAVLGQAARREGVPAAAVGAGEREDLSRGSGLSPRGAGGAGRLRARRPPSPQGRRALGAERGRPGPRLV